MKRYDQKVYKLPPPTPGSCNCRDKQTTFGRTARDFLQTEQNVYLTRHQTTCGSCVDYQTFHGLGHPSTHPPVQIPIFQPPVQTPAVPKTSPVQIPDPPVQIPVFQPPVPTTPPVQFFLPDPPPVQILLPPVVETLEPTPTDDSSIDQIMSVFGDCSQKGLPLAHTQEPQLLDTVPSLFDESNDLISFFDHFETGLAIEQQETPMDLTMPRLKKKVRKTIGFKVIKPLDLSLRNCLPCM
ncbi:hypothetical protein TNCV_373291 [Trichonephila clavipes]|nr:hypothetical protein TNCV_373291 [Trichonephila clavipes]